MPNSELDVCMYASILKEILRYERSKHPKKQEIL